MSAHVRRAAFVFLLLPLAACGGSAEMDPAGEQPAGDSGKPTTLSVTLQPVVEGLQMPTGLSVANDGSGRLFITERRGTIRVIRDGEISPRPFLDIFDQVESGAVEQGLLRLAFHPNYLENGRFFVHYTAAGGTITVSEFRVSRDDPNHADPASERRLIEIPKQATNHNGGQLVFGHDGYLYIGVGDGGNPGDPFKTAQNLNSLLGKILRIDVDNGEPYAIPPDNPFIDTPDARPEVWAYGLRNPWRFSFDLETGRLFLADVGQNMWEEVNVLSVQAASGANFGWPLLEGTHCYQAEDCDHAGTVLPVIEYPHTEGCAVVGGYVYRDVQWPELADHYVYGDFCQGHIWAAREEAGRWTSERLLAGTYLQVSAFGQDEAGDLYLVDLSGSLYRLTGGPAS
jgi:glucose/arabinose dehydrogenase